MEKKKKKSNGCLIIAMLFSGMVLGMIVCGLIGLVAGIASYGSTSIDYDENIVREGGG